MHNIKFKPLNENDLPLLYQWFQVPHILQWYARGEEYTLDRIKEKYSNRINNQHIQNYIIYHDDKPIGYIQLYHVSHYLPEGVSDYRHSLFTEYSPNEMAGIDIFIAEESFLNKGYGSAALRDFIAQHVKGKFKLLVSDPLKCNSIAIHFFEKNGFKILTNQSSINELLVLAV